MAKVRVACFGISLDGYGAGPNQSLEHPLGVRGTELMQWFFPTRTFQKMHDPGSAGAPSVPPPPQDPETEIDDGFAARSFENIGAWILGRNMFGPIRGPWPNEEWKGWWGDTPPYHCDVFVLTQHARRPLAMNGGTTFHFVTDGPEAALQRARAAAKEKDVRIGGGVATVRHYLRSGAVDELHLAQSPVLLGSGEPLFAGLNLDALGYRVTNRVPSAKTTHLILTRP